MTIRDFGQETIPAEPVCFGPHDVIMQLGNGFFFNAEKNSSSLNPIFG